MPTQTAKPLTLGDVAVRIDDYRRLYAAAEYWFNRVEQRRRAIVRRGRRPGAKLVGEWMHYARMAGQIQRALQRFCATHHIELCGP